MATIKNITEELTYFNTSIYIQEIYDHRQTHAVYAVDQGEKEKVIQVLEKYNCNRFRVVKVKKSRKIIVCFNILKSSEISK